ILLVLDKLDTAHMKFFYPRAHDYYKLSFNSKPRSFYNAAKRLKNKGLIIKTKKRGANEFALSPQGKETVKRIKLKLEMSKKRKWDRKWRLLIFDIPEKVRTRRDFFRRELNNFGFYQLQKSVWAYPYPLPKDFLSIWQDLGIGDLFIVVESAKLSNDEELRNFFFPAA
ncbi:hypothetical protein ACFL3E_02065, partial [Patescibacteria group bacterium]